MAVTITVPVVTLAAVVAVSVSVSFVELTLDAGETGFVAQLALTPVGKSAMAKFTLPLKEPPVATLKLMAPEVPCTIEIAVAAGVMDMVGSGTAVSE